MPLAPPLHALATPGHWDGHQGSARGGPGGPGRPLLDPWGALVGPWRALPSLRHMVLNIRFHCNVDERQLAT